MTSIRQWAEEARQKAEKEKPPRFNFWYEMLLTFSNKKSVLSSKKIERFIVFSVFLILTVIYLALRMGTMEPLDFIQVVALWLGYGGWNSFVGLREKKIDNETPLN
jgi:hypothetical protein